MSSGRKARILVPVDYGPRSETAVRCAGAWGADRAELTLIRAEPAESRAFRWSQESRLRAFGATHLPKGARWRSKVVEGPPIRAIEAEIKRWKPDLVLMGTHGRRGLRAKLLGSFFEKAMGAFDVPILAVRAPSARSRPVRLAGPPRRVVLGMDGATASRRLFDAASKFSKLFGSELLVAFADEDLDAVVERAERIASRTRQFSKGLKVSFRWKEGFFPEKTLEALRVRNADLLVVGISRKPRRPGGFDPHHLHLIRSVDRPVLVVPEP